MRVDFRVGGLPPQSGALHELWQDEQNVERLLALREQALEARRRAGLNDCLRSLVSLDLTIYVPYAQLESLALDSFIAGVCHGLQAAPSELLETLPAPLLTPERRECHPRYPLLIEDISRVVFITARKVVVDAEQQLFYQVVVERSEMIFSL